MKNFAYYAPQSLQEALSLLDKRKGEVKILAGGTDLIVQMKDEFARPAFVMDVKKIAELNRLDWNNGAGLHVGAAVPLSKVSESPAVIEKFGILAQACSLIGSVQIRNRGTVGGNICNAAPSADTPPSLLCLGAKLVVAQAGGTRIIPLESFFRGPGQTALADNELLVEIQIPTPPISSAGCYLRHTAREEIGIAVVGVASFLVLVPGDKLCQEARIALAAVASTPIRAPQAEALLTGAALTEKLIDEAAELAAEDVHPVSDLRGSAAYRRELVKVLVRRSLTRAWEALAV